MMRVKTSETNYLPIHESIISDLPSGSPMSNAMEEIQSLQQQLEVMQKYAEEIDEKLAEFARTKESVAEMKNIKDAELYVPVASGMFAKVKGAQFDQLLVAVGAN